MLNSSVITENLVETVPAKSAEHVARRSGTSRGKDAASR